jgi:hypothetical protein
MNERAVLFEPDITRLLGSLLADKEAVLDVLGRLRRCLKEQPAGYRANRNETDPDFLFIVPIRLFLRGRWRFIRFSVNDTTSPDHFFVEAVSLSD